MGHGKVRKKDIINFGHQIDDETAHPAVDAGDRNKLVGTDPSTGLLVFFDKITSINFEVRDLEAADFFIVDLNAPFNYNILGITVQCDADTATLNVAVNATNVEFNSTEDVPVDNTKTYIAATSANSVSIDDTVKVIIDAISATRIYGSLKIEIL